MRYYKKAQNKLKRKAYIFVQNGEIESLSLYRRGIRQLSKNDRTIQTTTVE